jgi:hypothetical protein
VSEKTISRALGSLEEKKLIFRETKNVKGGKERHIHLTADKMTVNDSHQPTKSPLSTDNLSIVKGQNDLIKYNIKNKRKDNYTGESPEPPRAGSRAPISFEDMRANSEEEFKQMWGV